jgi:enoyl-CoA hydratase/carnithine racemase
MNDAQVISEIKHGAMWITLNRPHAMNSITPEILKGIGDALDEAAASRDIRAIVITGTGRAFCAGADLKYVQNQTSEGSNGADQFLKTVLATMNRLESFPMPVIAAVNGMALAGGLEFVLCCDLVIAARSAKFGDAHANYGLLPGGGGSVRLPRKIGPTRAKYLLYTGEFVAAEDLLAAGLVNAVVEDGALTSAVESLVAKLASKSPIGLRRMKALVDDGLGQPMESALRLELLASEVHAHSEDMKEGLAAFNEKRTPVFTGH